MSTYLDELVALIESPETSEEQREALISKLNIYGYKDEQVNQEARRHWLNFCKKNMKTILQDELELTSHLLEFHELKQCFDIAFEEYRNRKRDLGIDVEKFWNPFI